MTCGLYKHGCQCFASGCAYIGPDNMVRGCPANCCNNKCPGQTGEGKTLAYENPTPGPQWAAILMAVLVFLVILSTIFLI